MREIVDLYKKTGELHHAYLLEGEVEAVRAELFDFLEKEMKHPTRGNPDFWHEIGDTLSVERARALREMQSVKPISHERKIFVIEVRGMNIEAQNALLKMFEEPAVGTHFFIIAPSAEVFLPTLRSRMNVVSATPPFPRRGAESARRGGDFLSLSSAKRLEFVAGIIEEKNRAAAIELVDGIIIELGNMKPKLDKSKLSELLALRAYLNDRSCSLKLILEHCAVVL